MNKTYHKSRSSIFFSLLALLLLTIISCSKDKSDGLQSLYGKWYLKIDKFEYFENGIKDGLDIDYDFSSGDYVVFHEDGNFETFEGGVFSHSNDYVYDVKKSRIIVSSNDVEDEYIATVKLTKNTLILLEELEPWVDRDGVKHTSTRELTLKR